MVENGEHACVHWENAAKCGMEEKQFMYIPYSFVVLGCSKFFNGVVGAHGEEVETYISHLSWKKVQEG